MICLSGIGFDGSAESARLETENGKIRGILGENAVLRAGKRRKSANNSNLFNQQIGLFRGRFGFIIKA